MKFDCLVHKMGLVASHHCTFWSWNISVPVFFGPRIFWSHVQPFLVQCQFQSQPFSVPEFFGPRIFWSWPFSICAHFGPSLFQSNAHLGPGLFQSHMYISVPDFFSPDHIDPQNLCWLLRHAKPLNICYTKKP